MKPLIYRRQEARWDTTTNPMIAEHWYKTGSIVEIVDNGIVIDTWFKQIL